MTAREDIEALLAKHAIAGSWRLDVWPIGGTKRITGMVEWMREGEPIVERIVIQGLPNRQRAEDELLAALTMRLRGKL